MPTATFIKPLTSISAGRRPTARRAPIVGPSVERLEDRRLLSFGLAANYVTSYGPRDADVGDFNGDGRADVASATAPGIAVRLNNGDGTLAGEVLYPLAANPSPFGPTPLTTAVGDLNGDGKLDLVAIAATPPVAVYNYDDSGNLVGTDVVVPGHVDARVLLGDGTGSFADSGATYNLGDGRMMDAVLGDLDRDGDLDLVVSNGDGPNASVLLGNGDGTFAAPRQVVVGDATGDLDLADVNGDGRLDLVAASAFNDAVRLLVGDGNGAFQPPRMIATFTPVENAPTIGAEAVGDINGDGKLDLAVTYNLWYGGGEFYGQEYGPYAEGHVQALLGNGDGTFAAGGSYLLDGGYVTDVELADFDGDGRLDLVTGGYGGGNVSLLRGNGDGTFNAPESHPAGTANGGGPSDVAVADLDGNGALDIVTANGGANTISVLLNGASPSPSIRIGDASVTEGNAGTWAATFTVTLSAVSSQPVTVAYATAGGTAAAGSDYRATSGTLTIPAGQATGTITVPVNGDRLPEANETFFVNLSSPTNATIADGQGAGTIVDDEPRISIGDVSRKEGKKGQTTIFTFTVALSAAYDQPVTMSFRTTDGTARTSDNDYLARTGTLTFAAGETAKIITISVKGDSKRETTEYFYLDLLGNSGNSLFTKNRGVGSILNDD